MKCVVFLKESTHSELRRIEVLDFASNDAVCVFTAYFKALAIEGNKLGITAVEVLSTEKATVVILSLNPEVNLKETEQTLLRSYAHKQLIVA